MGNGPGAFGPCHRRRLWVCRGFSEPRPLWAVLRKDTDIFYTRFNRHVGWSGLEDTHTDKGTDSIAVKTAARLHFESVHGKADKKRSPRASWVMIMKTLGWHLARVGRNAIKAITNRRKLPGCDIEYYVQWKGWTSPEEDTWEPIENITGSGDSPKNVSRCEEEEVVVVVVIALTANDVYLTFITFCSFVKDFSQLVYT